ncbi:hypothetical protein MAP00_000403 [Monascus purpureus]|nr:hypothetical protein MAP00_000403 [Monascus purpureus]
MKLLTLSTTLFLSTVFSLQNLPTETETGTNINANILEAEEAIDPPPTATPISEDIGKFIPHLFWHHKCGKPCTAQNECYGYCATCDFGKGVCVF